MSDENLARQGMHLGVAFEAKIVVALDEHFVGNRSMRLMTNRAAFPQRFMLVNHRPRLFAVAFGAALVQPREADRRPHGEGGAVRRFEDVRAVRIMALHAIHPAFEDRVMLRQSKLRVNVEMTRKTCLRVTAGINNELASAARFHVQAAGSVTGFASSGLVAWRFFNVQSCMRAGGKRASEFGMTLGTGFVAHESCSFDFWRNHHSSSHAGTGSQDEPKQGHTADDN
jgi:hypothetical protein